MRYLTQILCPGSVELEAHFADREYRVKAGMLLAAQVLPLSILDQWIHCRFYGEANRYATGQTSQISKSSETLLRHLGEVMFYVPNSDSVINFLIHNDLLRYSRLSYTNMSEKNMRKVIRAAQRYGRKNGIRPLGHS